MQDIFRQSNPHFSRIDIIPECVCDSQTKQYKLPTAKNMKLSQ
jgi:hypothetical protein